MDSLVNQFSRIDHVAIAVKNLDEAIDHYESVLGFKLVRRREIRGEKSGMVSAELDANGFQIVLVQGTESTSQVSRYVEKYGPGVQHMAIEVSDLNAKVAELTENGVKFATNIIQGPGLNQIFTVRDENSGMMFEYIERQEENGFQKENIQKLFNQLEDAEAY